MIRRPPVSSLTHILVPDATPCRSQYRGGPRHVRHAHPRIEVVVAAAARHRQQAVAPQFCDPGERRAELLQRQELVPSASTGPSRKNRPLLHTPITLRPPTGSSRSIAISTSR